MDLSAYAYPTLVYVHLLLFVLWLGADVGVFLLGQHFRKRTVYTLDQRVALLKLLVIVDLTPRAAWALMVPLSLTVSLVGGWWESWLRYVLCAGYVFLGLESVLSNHPIEPDWLAWKALLFGLIFAAAIMIDVTFKPVGAQLGRLLAEGSSDETEIPLLATMNRTRIWVWCVYLLLLITAWLGVVKPV